MDHVERPGAASVPPVIRRYIEAYNRRDVPAMLACLSEDVRFENVTNGPGAMSADGKAAFAELATRSAAMFSERNQDVLMSIWNDEHVAIQVAYRATPSVNLSETMRAGEEVNLRGASFFTLRDQAITAIVDLS